MQKLYAAMLAGLMLAAAPTHAEDKAPSANAKTVWIDGKGQSSMADKVNKLHADMQAKGWRFESLEVYTEDGDMQGLFVTYVRDPSAAPATN